MKRRFNYTKREKIERNEVNIKVRGEERIFYDVDLNFAEHDFPDDAKVYIEAYHQTDYLRDGFGTWGKISKPENPELTQLGHRKNMHFRLKVVDEAGIHGMILGVADRIDVVGEGDEGVAPRCILDVNFDRDLGREAWCIDFSSIKPILFFDKKIPDIHNKAKSDPRILFYVYPAVIREILHYMVFVDGVIDPEEPAVEWHKDWIDFAKRFLPDLTPEVLNNEDEKFDADEVHEWIAKIATEFCNWNIRQWTCFIKIEKGEI